MHSVFTYEVGTALFDSPDAIHLLLRSLFLKNKKYGSAWDAETHRQYLQLNVVPVVYDEVLNNSFQISKL